ncbi:MAG: hypothetical protein CMP34_02625 [Rickettsiales bacterium]|nr:hypothetical protein [Rickettsiales bacterium]|tara:strand:- start:375 stop:860 length:486 start_codon:yes stop_codon:yes gene_type:complete
MKLLIIVIIFLESCAYKPVYNSDNFLSKYNINIIIKSKENYGKITNLLKLHLDQKLNFRSKKPSNLKLVLSVQKQKSGMGINKDLSTSGIIMNYLIAYSLYDKKGLLKSGQISKKSSFYLSENSYGNLVSEEDSSQKLILSLSDSISHILLAANFERKIVP